MELVGLREKRDVDGVDRHHRQSGRDKAGDMKRNGGLLAKADALDMGRGVVVIDTDRQHSFSTAQRHKHQRTPSTSTQRDQFDILILTINKCNIATV